VQGARSRKKWNRVRPTWTRLVGLTEASVNILVLAIGFGAAALVSRTVGQSDSGPGRWQIAGVVGRVRGLGDFRAIYQYAVKDANALVSQFTDDDFGSGSGVNVAGHAVRLEPGARALPPGSEPLLLPEPKTSERPRERLLRSPAPRRQT